MNFITKENDMKTNLLLLSLLLFSFTSTATTINIKKSSLTWKGTKITGDSHSGPIKIKKASLKNGLGEIVIDMNSIDETGGLKGKWKDKFLSHIKSADFLNVKKYPTAKLKIEKVDESYLYGKLTIKNKTNDVTIPFKKSGNIYSGEFGFDRTKYDMIYGSGSFFKNLGDKVIRDTVTLNFKIVTK